MKVAQATTFFSWNLWNIEINGGQLLKRKACYCIMLQKQSTFLPVISTKLEYAQIWTLDGIGLSQKWMLFFSFTLICLRSS